MFVTDGLSDVSSDRYVVNSAGLEETLLRFRAHSSRTEADTSGGKCVLTELLV